MMVSLRALGFVILLALCFSSSAFAKDEWLGRTVFFKPDAKARNGTKRVEHREIPFPAVVEEVQGEWLLLGPAWIRKSDVMSAEEALEFYTARIEARPFDVRSYTGRASVLESLGRFEEAVTDHSEAIRLDPKYNLPYYNGALARVKAHQYEEAQQDFREFLRREPRNAWGLRAYARFLILCPEDDLRDANESVRLSTRACELMNWKHPFFLESLAAAYSETGDFGQAAEWQTKAIDLMSDYQNEPYLGAMRKTLESFEASQPYSTSLPKEALRAQGY